MVPLHTAVLGVVAVAAVMALLWTRQLRTRNAGIVDVGWTLSVGALAVAAALLSSGWSWRRAAIAVVMVVWSARLGLYLSRDRVAGKPEDGRYAELRREWGAAANVRLFWFFQLQGVAAVFFALPAVIASANPMPWFSGLELASLALWLLAFSGEVTADRQLEAFKAGPASRGRTCRDGLWRYSRHPNYFFEWLMWVSYALFACASPGGLFALACPAAMLYLLLRVTGVPATEAQALRSRGDDYRRYQQSTNTFFPWLPRS